jgi:hypothetical protein
LGAHLALTLALCMGFRLHRLFGCLPYIRRLLRPPGGFQPGRVMPGHNTEAPSHAPAGPFSARVDMGAIFLKENGARARAPMLTPREVAAISRRIVPSDKANALLHSIRERALRAGLLVRHFHPGALVISEFHAAGACDSAHIPSSALSDLERYATNAGLVVKWWDQYWLCVACPPGFGKQDSARKPEQQI